MAKCGQRMQFYLTSNLSVASWSDSVSMKSSIEIKALVSIRFNKSIDVESTSNNDGSSRMREREWEIELFRFRFKQKFTLENQSTEIKIQLYGVCKRTIEFIYSFFFIQYSTSLSFLLFVFLRMNISELEWNLMRIFRFYGTKINHSLIL